MTKTKNIPCSVTICPAEATVLVVRVRPATTATRSAAYVCWSGRLEMRRCAVHAVDEASVMSTMDWRFFGDTITLSPLAD